MPVKWDNEGASISPPPSLPQKTRGPQKDAAGSTRCTMNGGERGDNPKQDKSEHDLNQEDEDGGDLKDNSAKSGDESSSELSVGEEETQQEEGEEDDDELNKLLDAAIFHAQSSHAKYDNLHVEFHQLTKKFTRAKELLIENDIPLESNHPPTSGSGLGKNCVGRTSAWKTLFGSSMERVWRAFSAFLLFLVMGVLFVMLGGSLSSVRVNSCLNPFYFKSASLYFSRCGEMIHDEPPII